MSDSQKNEEERLLEKLIEQQKIMNEKIETLLSKKIDKDVSKEKQKKEVIKAKVERSATFSYAIGGLTVAVGTLLMSFWEPILTAIYYTRVENFEMIFRYYWYGSGLFLIGGVLFILDGYIDQRYADEIGTIRKIKLFGRKCELVTHWKRDVSAILAFALSLAGGILIAAAFKLLH